MAIYSSSLNNSTTSLSENEEDELKEVANQAYYSKDVIPAQWSASTRERRPQTPPHSPASHLPPEILIHVIKQITSQRDLYNVLFVSRSWCECAVEFLWHRPNFQELQRFNQMLQVIQSGDRIFNYPHFVRRLNLTFAGSELTDDVFRQLVCCPKLERLTLVNCVGLSNDALLNVLPHFKNFVALDLTSTTSCSDKVIIALAKSATKLQGINLGGCKDITDEGVLAIAENCPLLRRIKLSGVKKITNKSVLAFAKQCPTLLEVDLYGCPKVTDMAIRALWKQLPYLRDFKLMQCSELTDLAFPADPDLLGIERSELVERAFPNTVQLAQDPLPPLRLSHLCDHLRMLDLSSCALITDDAIAGIIACAPKIRNLYLAKCNRLTDAAVESICKLGKHLHYLHLGHASSITDKSVRWLAQSCVRLRYIDLANCSRLSDMSVFELAGLTRLRRIGLVRVTNLTDQAIFALADRHSTLERIHLSYCQNITIMSIHFLLQRLTKLTHLSLTGIPAFRRPELQQFCRPAPREFNTNQRSTFCVYSGKGVDNLRLYLAALMANVHAVPDSNDDYDNDIDTDYDAEEDEELTNNSDQDQGAQHDQNQSMETPRMSYPPNWRGASGATLIAPQEVFNMEEQQEVATHSRTTEGEIEERVEQPEIRESPLVIEDTNLSSMATTPSPTSQPYSEAGPSSSRPHVRGFGTDLIVEAPTPSPQITPYASRQPTYSTPNLPVFDRANSDISDETSNKSSGTNKSATSNGAGFFRHYNSGVISDDSPSGAYTPDLIFAELGHGRGRSETTQAESFVIDGPGPSTIRQPYWRHEGQSSRSNSDFTSKLEFLSLNGSDTALSSSSSTSRNPQSRLSLAINQARPVRRDLQHHDPNSPIPYLSSSPTTRELQESVHYALAHSSGISKANTSNTAVASGSHI